MPTRSSLPRIHPAELYGKHELIAEHALRSACLHGCTLSDSAFQPVGLPIVRFCAKP